MATEAGTETSGYDQLRHRAYLFVRDEGGAVAEERLIDHVFGSAGNPALWRPLLRQVLRDDERLTRRVDGYWALHGVAAPDPDDLPRDYVVVDVETTGLKPLRARLIEVAAIRYRAGAEAERFSTLVNPDRRVPAYITQLTGIDEARLAGAPPFRDVASSLLRFLGDDLVVGFNVGFDLGFINAELKRLGRPGLTNPWLDLLPLANQLVPGVRKPGLDALCRSLGLPLGERHRAEPDAEATALLFGRLLELARERGLTTLDGLWRAADVEVPVPRRRGPVGRGRAVLDRSHLATIPRAPGVYLMHDAHNRVIYVGKAKNLRARVSSYYSQPLGYTRKMDGLLESIARIETVETGSELEALLLEAQLIRRYRPQYNTQLRNTESYPYIKIDLANPWPRVALTRQRADDDAVYFGPFRVARAARAAVELIQEVFPLRTCTRSFKSAKSYGSPCISLALGRCLGPCVGAADRDRYRGLVHDVVRFLKGDTSEVIGRLQSELEECAERLDFERAARLRDQIRRVQSLILSQQLLDEAVERGNALIVTPSPGGDGRGFLLVVRGRLWARVEAGPADNDADVAYRLERSWRRALEGPLASVDQDSLDEVHILGRWLRRYAGHPAILPLDGEPLDWLALARAGRALPAPALVFDGRAGGEPGGKDDAFSPVEDTW